MTVRTVRLGWAMERLGDALVGLLSFVRETGAPAFAALWALGAIVGAAILVRRRRDSYGWKVGASLLALGGAAGTLLWWSQQRGPEYYKYVDELPPVAERFRLRRSRLQVHGCVVRGSIERRAGTNEYRFQIQSPWPRQRAVLEVRYAGWAPDAFREGREIVVNGTLDSAGRLIAVPDGLITKCPSKLDSSAESWPDCGEPGS